MTAAPQANTPPMPPSLTERTTSGVAWGVVGAVAYQVFGLFVQTALTYVLTKEEYGTYGKAFGLLGCAMLLQQVGFTEVLLRRGERIRLWTGTAFWFALTLGVCGAGVLTGMAVPLGRVYNDPLLTVLLLLAAPLPIVRAFNIVPGAVLVHAMRFRAHYGLMLANAIVTSSLTLGLAYAGLGAKSFLIGMLISEPLYAAILWRCARPRVRLSARVARWKYLATDLKFVFGSNAARWARASTDPLILGLFATEAVVGLYFFAYSMVIQIVRVVTLNLAGVLLPALNKLTDDPERQTGAFLRASRVLMLVGAPMCVGIGAIGTLFVRVFLDAEKWRELPPVLAALSLGVAFRLLDEPVQSLIAAQGRFRLGFRLSVMTGVSYVLVCAVGSSTGQAINTAIAAAAYYLIAGPALLAIAIRPGGGTIATAAGVFVFPFLLSLVSIGPWVMLDRLVPGEGRLRDGGVLALMIAGSAITYAVIAMLVRPPGWNELLDRAHAMAPHRFRRTIARIRGGFRAPASADLP